MSELPAHFLDELRHFFEEYKKLERKTVLVEEFQDSDTAKRIVNEAVTLYSETYQKQKP
jgi:inorganic pyrophosphatase